jgi:cardiolipin synthase (CMP-forming)
MSMHRSFIRSRNLVGTKLWNLGKKRILVHISPYSNQGENTRGIVSADFRRDYSLLLRTPRHRHSNTCSYPVSRCFSTDQKDDKEHENERNRQFWAHWIRELQSPPNIITSTRILCTPLLSYWIITGNHKLALCGCFVAGVSDWVDGYLARNHGMATVLGAYLDPMADKIIINVLSATLWYTGILPGPLVALWFSRDILLIVGSASFVRSQSKDNTHAFDPTVTPLKVNPTMTSKVNTALQFILLGVGIVYPISNIPPEMLSGLW